MWHFQPGSNPGSSWSSCLPFVHAIYSISLKERWFMAWWRYQRKICQHCLRHHRRVRPWLQSQHCWQRGPGSTNSRESFRPHRRQHFSRINEPRPTFYDQAGHVWEMDCPEDSDRRPLPMWVWSTPRRRRDGLTRKTGSQIRGGIAKFSLEIPIILPCSMFDQLLLDRPCPKSFFSDEIRTRIFWQWWGQSCRINACDSDAKRSWPIRVIWAAYHGYAV